MTDPILLNRLSALEANVKKVANAVKAKDESTCVQVAPQVWVALKDTIAKSAESLLSEVKEIRELNDVTAAWSRYRSALDLSQPLFQESLELLGGLAFREQQARDESDIWQIADWLVHECSLVSRQEPSLTVPAPRDALRKTIARLIRLRFPESSIWTLPFAAQGYGHVLLATSDAASLGDPPGLLFPVDERVKREYPAAGDQVTGLVADAFATYIMGPAFVAATIELRLDPTGASVSRGEFAADSTRADVILETLRTMDEGRYAGVQHRLQEDWERLVQMASLGRDRTAPPFSPAAFVNIVIEAFKKRLPTPALYSEERWVLTQALSLQWKKPLESAVEPNTDFGQLNGLKLRDVVNAAWLRRIDRREGRPPGRDELDRVERAATQACKQLISFVSSGRPRDTAFVPNASWSSARK